jgi:hypothetical protein
MKIIIPSSKRSNLLNTLSYLRGMDVSLLIYADEVEQYKRHPVDIVICPERGIAKKRQFILENYDKAIMLDDDLSFATRRDDDATKFYPAQISEVCGAIEEITQLLDTYVHVGMAGREGGNRDTADHKKNSRAIRVHGWDCKKIRELGIRADDVEFMFDFHVTLSLLERGYPNVLLNWIVHDQKGSNTSGGCSEYRTMVKLAAAAHRLKELHPDFVTVVQKETKGAWGGGVRTDVRMAWARALQRGMNARQTA